MRGSGGFARSVEGQFVPALVALGDSARRTSATRPTTSRETGSKHAVDDTGDEDHIILFEV